MAEREGSQALGFCSGFRVEAVDGVVGIVETPLFPPDAAAPDYLVVRVARRGRVRRPVIATGFVERVDLPRRTIFVHGTERELARLPEHLPLAI